jgi:hypothetical protein
MKGFNRALFAREVTVGFDSAVGSLFEDEALILPDPHLPIRLKDEGFGAKINSANTSSKLWNIMKYGGAYTSLRILVDGMDGLLPKGNKGNDIEIDYTLIVVDDKTPKHDGDLVLLGEFKKGKGATGIGDSIQLNRAAQALCWHFFKVHGRKPKVKAYFVAGGAIDLQDIEFFAKADKLSRDISTFSKAPVGTPFTIRLSNAIGWGNMMGLNVESIRRILRIPLDEIKKFNDALLAVENYLEAGIYDRAVTINTLIRNGRIRDPPALWRTSTVRDRVERLKEIDIIPSLVWRKRELEKVLLAPSTNAATQAAAFPKWLGLVQALSNMEFLSDAVKAKYARLAALYSGQRSVPPTEPNLIEKIQLRWRNLKQVYYMGPEKQGNFMNHTGLLTNAPYLKLRNAELTAIIKNNNLSPANKLNALVKWNEVFQMGRTLSSTVKAGKPYGLIMSKWVAARNAVAPAVQPRSYENLINRANSENALNTIARTMTMNASINRTKRNDLSKAIGRRLQQFRRPGPSYISNINSAATNANLTKIQNSINTNRNLNARSKANFTKRVFNRRAAVRLAAVRGRGRARNESPVRGRERARSRSRNVKLRGQNPANMNKAQLVKILEAAGKKFNSASNVTTLRNRVAREAAAA